MNKPLTPTQLRDKIILFYSKISLKVLHALLRYLENHWMRVILTPPLSNTAGARSHLINDTTNAMVEKLFPIQKSNQADTKLPLQTFFIQHWHDLQGFETQFWARIMNGTDDRKYGTVNKTHVRSLKHSFTKGISDEEVRTKKSAIEKKWRATHSKER